MAETKHLDLPERRGLDVTTWMPEENNGEIDTATFLAHAAAVVREHHYVIAGATDQQPTWRAALERLELGAELKPADRHRAHEILGWVASLKPRDPDSYRAHLAGCLAHKRLTTRQLPLAASAVRAFNVHLYYEIRGRKHREQAEDR